MFPLFAYGADVFRLFLQPLVRAARHALQVAATWRRCLDDDAGSGRCCSQLSINHQHKKYLVSKRDVYW